MFKNPCCSNFSLPASVVEGKTKKGVYDDCVSSSFRRQPVCTLPKGQPMNGPKKSGCQFPFTHVSPLGLTKSIAGPWRGADSVESEECAPPSPPPNPMNRHPESRTQSHLSANPCTSRRQKWQPSLLERSTSYCFSQISVRSFNRSFVYAFTIQTNITVPPSRRDPPFYLLIQPSRAQDD